MLEYSSDSTTMIAVMMGQQDGYRRQRALAQPVEDRIGFARVDEYRSHAVMDDPYIVVLEGLYGF